MLKRFSPKDPNCMQKLFQLQNLNDLRKERKENLKVKQSEMKGQNQMDLSEIDEEMMEMDVDFKE